MDDDAPPAPSAPSGGPRVPTAWFLGLALVVLLPAVTGDPPVALVLAGLYLIVTAGWALLRRRSTPGALGRRGLSGAVALGVVVLLAGGAVAGPEAAGPATPTAAPAGDAPTVAATPTAEPPATAPTPEPSPPSPAPLPAETPAEWRTETARGARDHAEAPVGSALATARELEVKGRAPRTGYDRDLFGSGWVDTDRNGCDTRNDILARDLVDLTYRAGTRDCVVVSGTLADPYSGRSIDFVRGNDTSTAVQIDHVVALSDAWQKGAQQWDADTRVRFGNDPLNLLAVDGPLNMQKGDGDTATWLPPDRSYRCAYVARQVAVKHAYGLWVTAAEHDAMVRVLSSCPDEPLPTDAGPRPVTESRPRDPAPAEQPAEPSAPAQHAPFPNCTAAREAGAAPVRAGEPGYGTHLDRDGDGIGCE